MKKLSIFLFLVFLIILGSYEVYLQIPRKITDFLSAQFQVPVSIEKIELGWNISHIHGFTVGNLQSYSLPKSFSVKHVTLHASWLDFFKKNIQIKAINLLDIYVGLEFDSKKGTDGNWSVLMNNYKQNVDQYNRTPKNLTIKHLVFQQINTEVLFHDTEKGSFHHLPPVEKIELQNLSLNQDAPLRELAGTILGEMLHSLFIQENVSSFLKNLLNPKSLIQGILSPLKGLLGYSSYPPKTPASEQRSPVICFSEENICP